MDAAMLPAARATCLVLPTVPIEVVTAAQGQSWEQRASPALLRMMALEQTRFQGQMPYLFFHLFNLISTA